MYENSVSENWNYWGAVAKANRANKDKLVSVQSTGLYREAIGGFVEVKIGRDANGEVFVLQWDECKPNKALAAKIERLGKAKSKGRSNTGFYRLEAGKYVEVRVGC